MKRKEHGDKKLFTPANYPSLREFLSAYLHEDFGEEYGSVAEATRTFLADANGDEAEGVKQEWRQLRTIFAGLPLTELQAALQKLGAAWQPQSEADLKDLDEILSPRTS